MLRVGFFLISGYASTKATEPATMTDLTEAIQDLELEAAEDEQVNDLDDE